MSKFRNANGTRLLRGLFFETTPQGADKSSVVYTLKDEDHEGFPSLKRLYLETNDPTEYSFAIAYLDNLEHWDALCECRWFKPHITMWRRELELRYKSIALAAIMAEAKKDTQSKFNANKYILEKGWEPKESKNGRGRPSKAEISEEAARIAEEDKFLNQHAENIGLRVVK